MKLFIFCIALLQCIAAHETSLLNSKLLLEQRVVQAAPVGVAFVHYNVWTTPDAMLISYFTHEKTVKSSVRYGLSTSRLSHQVFGNAVTFKKSYGYSHHVLLSGLSSNTTYFFQCGYDDSVGWSSSIYSFRTRAAIVGNFTVGVWGDMGIDNSANTIKQIEARTNKNALDVAWHIGDISYADDHVFWFEETWNAWFSMIANVMAKVPYMTLPGNHEYASSILEPIMWAETRNFVAYNHFFRMPQDSTQEKNNSSMWYSFDYGCAHFISLSTESSYPNAPHDVDLFGDQIAWLKQDLAAASAPHARAQRPWIIVAGHRPIYSSGNGYSKNGVPEDSIIPGIPINSATLQKVFEGLFLKHAVDLVFAGHVHSYERLYPTAHNKPVSQSYVNAKAPAYVVVGNAGNIEGKAGFAAKPSWSAFRYDSGFGYGTLDISRQAMTWKFHHATDDRVLDTFTLQKN